MSLLGAARASLLGCALLLAGCGGHARGTSAAVQGGAVGTSRPGTARAALSSVAAAGDWTRFGYDAQRSGVGPVNTGIAAADLGHLSRRTVHLDGTVDSSPIELQGIRSRGRIRDVIIVTTTYGRTIAIDALTGARLWEYTPPGIGGFEGTAQVTTAAPVADPDRRYVYAASPDGRIRKLSVSSGHEVRFAGWPAVITFDASKEKIAGALNRAGRYVIAVTGGYLGDPPTYQGHIAMIDRDSGKLLHVFNTLCSNRRRLIVPVTCGASDSAIWARQGAVVEPGSGRILVATGNGPFNGSTNWGDSVLELTPDASQLLQNWTPTNQAQLNSTDSDVGSTAPTLLPATNGRRLALQGGKDGNLQLLDLAHLDGTRGGAGPRLGGALQTISAPDGGEVLTAPAVWADRGLAYVFVANDAATGAYALGGGPRPQLRRVWQQSTPGTSPLLAGGLLYVYDHVDGRLLVRLPTSGRTLISLAASSGHWNSPIVLGGRVVVPVGRYGDHATSGTLYIYHLPGR